MCYQPKIEKFFHKGMYIMGKRIPRSDIVALVGLMAAFAMIGLSITFLFTSEKTLIKNKLKKLIDQEIQTHDAWRKCRANSEGFIGERCRALGVVMQEVWWPFRQIVEDHDSNQWCLQTFQINPWLERELNLSDVPMALHSPCSLEASEQFHQLIMEEYRIAELWINAKYRLGQFREKHRLPID